MANPSLDTTGFQESYALVPNALLVAEDDAAAQDGAEALELAQIRLAGRARFADAAAQLAERPAIHLIAIEARGVAEAVAVETFDRLATLAGERRCTLIVAIAPDQIDLAAALLPGGTTQLLCDPSMADRVSALMLAGSRPGARVHDASREAESVRLQRLNEEVARIADTLARLTRGEEAGATAQSVRAPANGYRAQEAGVGEDISAGEVRAVIRARRLRDQFFEGELFADPAWDMLLDLFASELEHRRVSVSSLCIAAAVPPTTALRWIGSMHDAGLFERHADPADRRRAYIALSDKGMAAMRGYFAAAKRQGLSFV
jgi:hypothetical protein